jgi:hypothetical protein
LATAVSQKTRIGFSEPAHTEIVTKTAYGAWAWNGRIFFKTAEIGDGAVVAARQERRRLRCTSNGSVSGQRVLI